MHYGVAWATLVVLCPIYFFLHIYLEAIIPDAYGVTESCCFCLRKGKDVDEHDSDEDADLWATADKSLKDSTINS